MLGMPPKPFRPGTCAPPQALLRHIMTCRPRASACLDLVSWLMLRPPQSIIKHTQSVALGEIEWKKFPDGFPNIFVHDVESIKGCHLVFLACFQRASDIFEQVPPPPPRGPQPPQQASLAPAPRPSCAPRHLTGPPRMRAPT